MSGTEVATTQGSLAVRPDQTDWTDQQKAGLAQLGIDEAPLGDQLVFLHVAQKMGLDPFNKEIYLIGRWDGKLQRKKWTIQVAIDGFRSKSEEHPEFGGIEGPDWCGPDGQWRDVWTSDEPPVAARFTVHRKDWSKPVTAVAHYREYVQKTKDGAPTTMWANMPAGQIGKCFDHETEVLTEHGYRRFADVGESRIMQVTAGGLEAVAATPFVRDYDGLMVTFDSDDLNFSVTPNHDMVTTFGVVEASAMYATALSRPTWRIPRLAPPATGPGLDLSNDAIQLAAAIVADGTRTSYGWQVEVSRPTKIAALDSFGMSHDRYIRHSRGTETTARSGRVIRTNFDKQGYRYRREVVDALVAPSKSLRTSAIRAMNSKQARLLADTLIEFDGTTNRKTGVRRFLTSNPATVGAFELAATIAGYTVNQPSARYSDLSDRPNWWITISERDDIGFVRARDGRKSIEMTPNTSGRVWCVTVPSGLIMVRRRGFSMVCANCAEALARRKAFPRRLSGVYIDEELQHLSNPEPPMVIESQREEVIREPDWDTLIHNAEWAGSRDEMTNVWNLAKGMRRNDTKLLDRIAAAGERIAATTAPDTTEPTEPDRTSQ